MSVGRSSFCAWTGLGRRARDCDRRSRSGRRTRSAASARCRRRCRTRAMCSAGALEQHRRAFHGLAAPPQPHGSRIARGRRHALAKGARQQQRVGVEPGRRRPWLPAGRSRRRRKPWWRGRIRAASRRRCRRATGRRSRAGFPAAVGSSPASSPRPPRRRGGRYRAASPRPARLCESLRASCAARGRADFWRPSRDCRRARRAA